MATLVVCYLHTHLFGGAFAREPYVPLKVRDNSKNLHSTDNYKPRTNMLNSGHSKCLGSKGPKTEKIRVWVQYLAPLLNAVPNLIARSGISYILNAWAPSWSIKSYHLHHPILMSWSMFFTLIRVRSSVWNIYKRICILKPLNLNGNGSRNYAGQMNFKFCINVGPT